MQNQSDTKPDIQPVIIAPTFNNASTLADFLKQLDTLELTVIVVNDGSDDETDDILIKWRKNWRLKNNHIITHKTNQGKAGALYSGFFLAAELGFTHAITIDTDGQHKPQDCIALLEKAREYPDKLILGIRKKNITARPWTSRAGQWISNKLISIESGVKVSDSQSGFRIYPLNIIHLIDKHWQGYTFETEIITRLGWAKQRIIEVPISCIYKINGKKRVSHFRIWQDSLLSVWMHLKLLLLSLLPGKIINKSKNHVDNNLSDNLNIIEYNAEKTGTILDRILHWLNPLRVFQEVRLQGKARKRLAVSLGVGIFIAPLPVYGIKTVVCLATAKLFRLEPLAVIGASSLSTPPLGVILVILSIIIGNVVIFGHIPDLSMYSLDNIKVTTVIWEVLIQWIAGSIILGTILGFLTYILASFIGKLFPIKKVNIKDNS